MKRFGGYVYFAVRSHVHAQNLAQCAKKTNRLSSTHMGTRLGEEIEDGGQSGHATGNILAAGIHFKHSCDSKR